MLRVARSSPLHGVVTADQKTNAIHVSALSADTVRPSSVSPRPMKVTFEINLFLGPLQLPRHLVSQVTKVRTVTPGDTHEHAFFQTHDFRGRSRNERPHYGRRRIYICIAGTPAFVCDLFRPQDCHASMVYLVLRLRRDVLECCYSLIRKPTSPDQKNSLAA